TLHTEAVPINVYRTPRTTHFPYTTLFRSRMLGIASVAARELVGARAHRRRRVGDRALAGRIQGAARGAEGARPVARPAHRAARDVRATAVGHRRRAGRGAVHGHRGGRAA